MHSERSIFTLDTRIKPNSCMAGISLKNNRSCEWYRWFFFFRQFMSHAHTYIFIYFESNTNVLFNLDWAKHKHRLASEWTYAKAWSYNTASIYTGNIFKSTSRYKSHELCTYLFFVWFILDFLSSLFSFVST